MEEIKEWEKEVIDIIKEHIVERDLGEEYQFEYQLQLIYIIIYISLLIINLLILEIKLPVYQIEYKGE